MPGLRNPMESNSKHRNHEKEKGDISKRTEPRQPEIRSMLAGSLSCQNTGPNPRNPAPPPCEIIFNICAASAFTPESR
jgi:hypothetical protein